MGKKIGKADVCAGGTRKNASASHDVAVRGILLEESDSRIRHCLQSIEEAAIANQDVGSVRNAALTALADMSSAVDSLLERFGDWNKSEYVY